MVHAATTRLLEPDRHADQAPELMEQGFRVVKVRFRRQDPRDPVWTSRWTKRV